MLVSSIGFKNYVWFISLGYGLGISITGILLLCMYHGMMDVYGVIACIIFILYGFRLSGYLAYREFVGKTYLKNMKGEIKSGKGMPFFVKCMLHVHYYTL